MIMVPTRRRVYVRNPDGDPRVARGGATRAYQGDSVEPIPVAAGGSPERRSQHRGLGVR